MADLYELLAWLLLGFLGYAILLNRAAHFVQPARKELARLGEELLAEGALRESEREEVRFYLNNAFSGLMAPIAALIVPIFLLIALPFYFATGKWREVVLPYDAEIVEKYRRAHNLFNLSVVAANPLFGLVLLVELAILGFVFMLVGGTIASVQRALSLLVSDIGLRFGH